MNFTTNEPVQAYQVMNIAGEVMLTGTNASTIDVSTLVAGIYFIEVSYLDRSRTIKFVKK